MFEEISNINFIRGIHLCASLFGGIFLILIWKHVQRLKDDFEQDWGLILISLALIVWSVMDMFNIVNDFLASEPSWQAKLFSTFNNAFLIAALPFFKFGFEKIKDKYSFFRTGKTWALIVLVLNTIIILFFTTIWSNEKNTNALEYFDFFYSTIAFSSIGYAVIIAFRKRHYGLPFTIISSVIIFFLIITQMALLPEFRNSYMDLPKLLMIASHIIFISMLLVLAQSWVVEENVTHQKKIIADLKKDNEELHKKLQGTNSEINLPKSDIDLSCLTNRESEVFKLLAKDLSYKEIGNKLYIARDTVISNVRSIEKKLNVKGKSNLIKISKKHNT